MTTLTQTALPTGTWTIDPAHSSAEFRVKHLALASFKGRFTDIDATIADGRLEGTVPVESVTVKVPDLKSHLLSPEFFDAERHPEIRFVSTDVRGDGDDLVVGG